MENVPGGERGGGRGVGESQGPGGGALESAARLPGVDQTPLSPPLQSSRMKLKFRF